MSEVPESHSADVGSAGAALLEERRRQSLSIGDVSRHLKLSVRQVEALEKDQFEIFGGAVFVHGFLRNYAKLLGLDPVVLIEAADRTLAPPEGVAGEVTGTATSSGSPQKSLIPLFLSATILIVGVLGWMLTREGGLSFESAPTVNEAGPTTTSNDSMDNAAALTEPGAEVPVADEVVSQSPPEQIANVNSGVIRLVFEEESWVEITDRYGEIIFTDLGPRGESRTITGKPPFSLVIGNAAGVKLIFNDKAIDLGPHTRVDVARLNLE